MNQTKETGAKALMPRPPSDGKQATVLAQIAELQTLTHDQIKERWRELYEAPLRRSGTDLSFCVA